jgi:hypothetical protein
MAPHQHVLIEWDDALNDGFSEKVMQIHMQRLVRALVGSAHGAERVYDLQSEVEGCHHDNCVCPCASISPLGV